MADSRLPGGIVLALDAACRPRGCCPAPALGFVEFFRKPCRWILLVYWAYYVHGRCCSTCSSPASPPGLGRALPQTVSAYNAETFRRRHRLDPQRGPEARRRWRSAIEPLAGDARGSCCRRRRAACCPVLASHLGLAVQGHLAGLGDPRSGEPRLHGDAESARRASACSKMLTAMAAIYWALGYPQAKLVDWLHRKYGVSEVSAPPVPRPPRTSASSTAASSRSTGVSR